MSEGERSLVVVQIIIHKSRFAFWILIFDIFSASPRFGWEIYKIVPSRLTSRHTTHQTLLLLSFFVKYVITKIIHPRCFPYHFFLFFKRRFHEWLNLIEGKKRWKIIITWLSCCSRCRRCRSLVSKYRSHIEWRDWDKNHEEA